MDPDGQRTPASASAVMASLLSKRAKLLEELRNIERQKYKKKRVVKVIGLPLRLFGSFLNAIGPVGKLSYAENLMLKACSEYVYDMETSYLQDPSQCGNVLKGFEGFLSSSKNTALLKRSRKFQPEDRLFSLSSVTSPAAEEQAIGRDDGRSDYGPGRSKGGGIFGNGQGKPKKGRGASRDAKRIRHSSEDFDYDDDPDVTL
ncbi:hypothetical protein Pint_01736 [Pistacia integerrima]|uniref:Uncharacterized protein n=1 Tax=Pistacia integerrima TaxID=434235 RepID=A0ACC0ZLQ7_9ROSI|nr:hypothetical protein Pint_01736 [Pistacia integerrima]